MKLLIVIPCYNEERILEENIERIVDAAENLNCDTKILISDNNSKDKTGVIGKRLSEENKNIEYVFVPEQGKGAAVIEAWKKEKADIYGFMDADLATDLRALSPAIKSFTDGYDIVIGSRRHKKSEVYREAYRKFTSFMLGLLIKLFLGSKLKDTACGFKFFKKQVIEDLLLKIRDRAWTFDTELLILAERAGYRIKSIPVRWTEKGERTSKVVPIPTILGYLRKIFELRKRIKQ